MRFEMREITPERIRQIARHANFDAQFERHMWRIPPDRFSEHLESEVRMSSESFCACLNDTPVAILGVRRIDDRCAAIWAVATEDMSKVPRDTVRWLRYWLKRWSAEYGVLFNVLPDSLPVTRRWLELGGCKFVERHEEVNGTPVKTFYYKETDKCA